MLSRRKVNRGLDVGGGDGLGKLWRTSWSSEAPLRAADTGGVKVSRWCVLDRKSVG